MTMFNYIDATEERNIRALKAKSGFRFDKCITMKSPTWQKNSMVQIRRYLGLECNYGCNMDASDHCWDGVEVYPVIEGFYDNKKQEWRERAVCGVCMSTSFGCVVLEFCWIHPFYRNQGKLKKLWPELEAKYGWFYVMPTVTKTMQAFLKSVGYEERRTC